jgi:hypothetical protein
MKRRERRDRRERREQSPDNAVIADSAVTTGRAALGHSKPKIENQRFH